MSRVWQPGDMLIPMTPVQTPEAGLMATYGAAVKWRRTAEERFTDQRYSRVHDWLFDGGAQVHASASPHSVRPPFSDPSAVDPEEALIAALSSCHMLVLSLDRRHTRFRSGVIRRFRRGHHDQG